MALFGAVWAVAGAPALGGIAGTVALVSSWAVALALCLGAVKLRRAARGLPRVDPGRARSRRDGRISRSFNLVFGLHGVAIAVSVVLLVRNGLGTLIPAVVAIVVGFHYFPLAELFRVRAYHATGAALCALGAVALLLAPSTRLPVVGLGCAATLFATAAYVLVSGGLARRPDAPEL